MKTIIPKFEIIPQHNSLEGLYKHIEFCGRVCYKSENNITQDSAMKFVNRIIKSGHGSVLEHGTIYLTIPDREPDEFGRMDYGHIGVGNYGANKYSRVTYRNYSQEPNKTQKDYCSKIPRTTTYVTTNLRVLVENDWMDDLKYLCEPTEYHERRVTVKFICSRAISHELVRHRVFSFSQESQRYCNYSLDKFDNEITFIDPLFSSEEGSLPETSEAYDNAYEVLCSAWENAEAYYFTLLDAGFKPQEAREVLPNSTKTEIIMTGFKSDWEEFFRLRTDSSAHPEMRRLVIPLELELNKE